MLAAIVFKVGTDIVDREFLGRVPRLSQKGAFIAYVVIALTVLVDLTVAVGVGIFIASIITIDKMSVMQTRGVKSVGTGDDDADISDGERQLLNQAAGRVLLFQLNGAP